MVADFGLSRDIYAEDYYKMQSATPLPVKWLAPEALFDREFSVKTDVVSRDAITHVDVSHVLDIMIIINVYVIVRAQDQGFYMILENSRPIGRGSLNHIKT